ncbi:hypothetical protein DL95DRAFT_430412 [Leptodontidium sp. 2 PMI_412]|nr:hypothetical protein DL95DRAFT_430412 [Leptodontidium sp. 2 PMI_412]
MKEAYRPYRGQVDRLFQGGANTIAKEHFTSVYSPAREREFTKRNITSSCAACGLFPLNPDRVLRKTPKPPAQSTVPRAVEINVGLCQQDEVPQTSVTPVTADAFIIPRLQRRVQKLANAGQRSIAYCALLDDQNQFLTKMNNEAKVRRSTKSVVLGKGKAKVMSYEDTEEARATRVAKHAMKAQEADELEPEVARMIDVPKSWRAPLARMF